MEKLESISVIIPCDGRPSLADTLSSIRRNQTGRAVEILVAGALPPGDFPGVRVIPAEGVTTGALRNRAAEQAVGGLLLFTDSDCIVDPDWIDRLASAVSEKSPVVGGGIRFPEDSIWDLGDNLAVFQAVSVYRRARAIDAPMGTNNLAVTAASFRRVGGFRNDLTVGEDWEFLQRVRKAGIEVFFEPRAAVLHRSGRDSPDAVRAHAEWYARGYAGLMAAGLAPSGPGRAERWIGGSPAAAALWSAGKALFGAACLYGPHPAFWRYLRALPSVVLFYYTRRRMLFRLADENQTSHRE